MVKINKVKRQNSSWVYVFCLLVCVMVLGMIIFTSPSSQTKNLNKDMDLPNSSDFSWEAGGSVVCNASGHQKKPLIVSDGDNGAILTWLDQRDGKNDIYAQRIKDGVTLWNNNGTAILTNGSAVEGSVQMISDSEGGAIILWKNYYQYQNSSIYAQRIDSTGNTLWGANGTKIADNTYDVIWAKIISCGNSNNDSIIVWTSHAHPASLDVIMKASKVNNSGVFYWSDIEVGTFFGNNGWDVCTDNSGGALIVYADGDNSDSDIYGQRIDSSGSLLFGGGIRISEIANVQLIPQIASDGAGGAYITWHDDELAQYITGRPYWQHISSSGILLNPEKGLPLTEFDVYSGTDMIADGNGGAFITFGSINEGFITRVNTTDTWTTSLKIGGDLHYIEVISDNNGGAITVWQEQRQFYSICAQRIDENGEKLWGDNGTAVFDGNSWVILPHVCADDQGNALITWEYQVYAELDVHCAFLATEYIPHSTHPDDLVGNRHTLGGQKITWMLSHTRPGGGYKVFNRSAWNPPFIEGGPWNDGHIVEFEFDISSVSEPRTYVYEIYFWDAVTKINGSDRVIVTVQDLIPYTNDPEDISLLKGDNEIIMWKLYDEWGEGEYRIVMANNVLNLTNIIRTWTAWENGTEIILPIESTWPGVYSYTIEYTTTTGELASDTVLVTILDKTRPLGRDIVVYVLLGIVSVVAGGSVYLLLRLYKDTQAMRKELDELKNKKSKSKKNWKKKM